MTGRVKCCWDLNFKLSGSEDLRFLILILRRREILYIYISSEINITPGLCNIDPGLLSLHTQIQLFMALLPHRKSVQQSFNKSMILLSLSW